MEFDGTPIVIVLLVWMASPFLLVGFAWRAPIAWGTTVRLMLMLTPASVFVIVTSMAYGTQIGAIAAILAGLVMSLSFLRRG